MRTSDNFKKSRIYRMATENQVFKLAVQSAFNHIIITDTEGTVLYANSAAERITGYTQKEILGNTPRLWGGLMAQKFYEKMWDEIKERKKPFEGELRNIRKNGEEYDAKAIISPIMDGEDLLGFIGTEEDITQEKEVDQMKTEFISITAHQLKTPLTSMRWSLEMLEDTSFGELSREQLEMLSSAKNSNRRLVLLVDTLLNISRIESGRLAINPEPTDIKGLIELVVAGMADKIKKAKHTVKIDVEDTIKSISIDPQMTRELIKNLLINAVKYTPNGGEIIVSVRNEDGDIILEVRDSGIGIPKNEQHRIFQRFYRGSNIESSVDGTGLGLYFVKLIADASGGKIWFETIENQGTSFFFSIPKTGTQAQKGEVSLNAGSE